jgi:hypothetical protein
MKPKNILASGAFVNLFQIISINTLIGDKKINVSIESMAPL